MRYTLRMVLDRLRFHNVLLEHTDIPSEQIEELALLIDESASDRASNTDVGLLSSDVRRWIAEHNAEMHQQLKSIWIAIIGVGGGIIAALIGVIITLLITG